MQVRQNSLFKFELSILCGSLTIYILDTKIMMMQNEQFYF